MTARSEVRLALSERQLWLLVRCVREASTAGLLRVADLDEIGELVVLLDQQLPDAAERHPAGRLGGEAVLGDAILRVLSRAEDEGFPQLRTEEIDARLSDKPLGTSIWKTLLSLRRAALVVFTTDSRVALTRDGRARARRPLSADAAEHAVVEPEQLLDLIYRARCGGMTRWNGDKEIAVDEIWHVPTVQGCCGTDRARFDALLAGLIGDGLVGPGEGSYMTLTEAGARVGGDRARALQVPGGSFDVPRLLPPVRRPGEIIRRRSDLLCPVCGHPASWLRTRSNKRHDELRATGLARYDCTSCSISWIVYAEPVDHAGEYDPFGKPARCRARWALRGGYWDGPALAPPDHWRAS